MDKVDAHFGDKPAPSNVSADESTLFRLQFRRESKDGACLSGGVDKEKGECQTEVRLRTLRRK